MDGSIFPPEVNAELDRVCLRRGTCAVTDQPEPGCGRPVSEFIVFKESVELSGLNVRSKVKIAVRRYRCPCGKVWLAGAGFVPPEGFDCAQVKIFTQAEQEAAQAAAVQPTLIIQDYTDAPGG